METIKLSTTIQSDGHLKIDIPTPLDEGDVEVILIKSLNPAIDKKIDKLWAVEAEKRLESIKKKSVKTIPADEVFGRIRKRFKK